MGRSVRRAIATTAFPCSPFIFMRKLTLVFGALCALLASCGAPCSAPTKGAQTLSLYQSFHPGKLWFDTDGRLINAHGGGMLYHDGRYYWYGEHKGELSCAAFVGVTCYSSTDLYNWTNEGVAFAVTDEVGAPTESGCTIERPKVIYCGKTGKFVMYFHLELKGHGYDAANVAVAVADKPTGPFTLLWNGRVNAGLWPEGMTEAQKLDSSHKEEMEWWTDEWREKVAAGMMTCRDFEGGQMSRDMTLFVDDDGKAYHIYSSEENLTLQIAELTDDYTDYTGRYVRVDPVGHNEAPAIFKRSGKYYMITSGCTGWAPNEARLHVSDNIMGPWTRLPNPCRGKGAELTFGGQSTYILPVEGREDTFIFMADLWKPENPIDGRYIWLPIQFDPEGLPVIEWQDEWAL